jgi:acetyltransferase, GNAT family
MKIKKLTEENIRDYIEYLKIARSLEPSLMMTDAVDDEDIIKRLSKDNDRLCKSLLAYEDDKVIGRLEYHFYTCLQDNYRMCYVDWVYTLPSFRCKGVAKSLFKELEKICLENNINQYFLIQADNDSATQFYASFHGASSQFCSVLRKTLI